MLPAGSAVLARVSDGDDASGAAAEPSAGELDRDDCDCCAHA
jgi:hypothetical protein